MSRDQRPGRVRVVSQDRSTATPRRRREDMNPAAAASPAPGVGKAGGQPTASSGFPLLALAVLFIVGCGVGGALIAAFGLFEARPV
ncbi:hypothetical protein [Sphingomonas sp. KC8]|uniref:hypothetical protein n=1 Tax=Sphingomonas sp. KC8 TaxID=1030157 RepID=UPI0002488AA5|nr:hypothetical protein [Sphingomonas sp. KC8]ARS28955.1 hypothetical protein KC8_16930 [Sphingomonas sp. KC8]